MKKIQTFFTGNRIANFTARTVLYFVILVGLLYLYHYSGIGQGGFLYNEF
ncbi:teichoic acid D-Ala incorporation-associated protein DltX [Streptococcaceae bacterium ESL0687]|nr:teichoic acid D-Ala incorporation-associated protein DltX [Streptococcaceae bacterium ESL0687]WEV60706.1 teichoic acid D-Ala incorporation-associated protein DltX [Streptococcaceae bacterium ESL0729]